MLENFIWYEKYRPKSISEMSLSKRCKANIKHYIKEKNIPHLLFFGPQGSGKTTVSKIIMDSIPCQTLELNASSEDRGIGVIKGKVKGFASSQTLPGKLKIVFLDEADGLTKDAQRALKNTIETYSKSCRFILTANNVERIIPEIRSRCIQYKFDSFSKEKLLKLLKEILKKEGVKDVKEKILKKIIKKHYPDIRSVINTLQSYTIDSSAGIEIFASDINYEEFDNALISGKVKTIRNMVSSNPPFEDLYKHLFTTTILKFNNEEALSDAAIIIANYLYKDNFVVDREINFIACCISLMKVFKCKISFNS